MIGQTVKIDFTKYSSNIDDPITVKLYHREFCQAVHMPERPCSSLFKKLCLDVHYFPVISRSQFRAVHTLRALPG